jgi:hypothetical protein
MRDLQLSSKARSLLEAAKADAPSMAARAKIWSGVAGAGAAAGVGAAALGSLSATHSVAVTATASSAKLLAAGALFGSAVTVGLALALVHVTPSSGTGAPTQDPSHVVPTVTVADLSPPIPLALEVRSPLVNVRAADLRGSRLATGTDEEASRVRTPLGNEGMAHEGGPHEVGARLSPSVPRAPAHSRAAAGSFDAQSHRVASLANSHPVYPREDDSLMREAALVAEARGAIVRGDAQGALNALSATSRLASRDLEPEELSLKAHALRMLGREAEAAALDSSLKMRFPDHALAR